jgi:Fe-S oxidoreductase
MDLFTAIAVTLIMVTGFGIAGYELFWKLRYVVVGQNDGRADLDDLGPRAWGFVKYVFGQARTIREFGGMLHFFIFWAFVVLQVETIEFFVRGYVPGFHLSSIIGASAYDGILLVQDVVTFLCLIAVIAAIIRRFVIKPDHTTQTMDGAIILWLEVQLILTKYLAHGFEILHYGTDDLPWTASYTPFSLLTAEIFGSDQMVAMGTESAAIHWLTVVFYLLHLATVAFFAYWIATGGKHIHLVGATSNVFFRKLEPKGSLYPLDLEDEEAMSFGAGKMEDLSWKQLLDSYACTECARCEHYCPAFNTGKELNPMMIIQKLKTHVKEKGRRVYREGEEDEFPMLAGGIISKEELMACTTCGACVQNCPVFIEHVDTIIDLRRYLVLTEADVSPELTRTFRNIENNSNPWGVSNSRRADWAEGVDVPLLSELDHVPEYLFWVGCAGSFDDRAKKVTNAMAKILDGADVDYAILGPEENCTGDPARRTGNEYVYYMQATQNVETLNEYGVTKIITTCPHCFHTIGKEYPQLGGDYEVVHHTKLLNDLLAAGRVRMAPGATRKYAYHDSCYIGRWNSDYDNPRETLEQVPGVSIAELAWNKRKSLCCGAGGGRMWMEEDAGKRVNMERTDMVVDTKPDGLVVNCPFCMTMLSDGLNAREQEYEAYDLAEVVADQMVVDDEEEEAATDAAE